MVCFFVFNAYLWVVVVPRRELILMICAIGVSLQGRIVDSIIGCKLSKNIAFLWTEVKESCKIWR